MKKKNILICIISDLFIRNYLLKNSFKDIETKYNCYYIGQNTLNLKNHLKKKKNFLGFYNHDSEEKKKYAKFHWMNTFFSFYKSKSITYLGKKYLKIKFFRDDENIFNSLILFPLRIILKISRYVTFYFYRTIFKIFKTKLINPGYPVNNFILKNIDKLNPSLIIVPSGGQGIGYYDILRISEKKNIKTLGIIDNWDNMSSRIHYELKPSNYAVWGEQSKLFARKIQNFKKNIYLIGTSRFENYFYTRTKKLKSHFKFKYFLFTESYDMTEGLEELFDNLDILLKRKFNSLYKLVYRPHPWRKEKKIIDFKKYDNIIVDPQLRKQYYNSDFSHKNQPNINYYPSLIQNAKIILSGPGSMVIESLIFWKKIIILAHDKKYDYGMYNYMKNFDHFDGISNFKNIKVCSDLNKLNNIFSDLMSHKNKVDKRLTDKKRSFYLFHDKKKFSKRIENIVGKIIV